VTERDNLVPMDRTKNFLVIWGVAHADNVPGKESPDGRHKEEVWSKEQCTELDRMCRLAGIDSVVVQPLSDDLRGRMDFVDKCNALAKPYKKALLISLHNNAAGNGLWMDAEGWLIYTSRGWTDSDVFAEQLYHQLVNHFPEAEIPVRTYSREHPAFEENWTVLMGMYYNAILIEWLFQDDKEDLERIENKEICQRLREVLYRFVKDLAETQW